MPSSNIYIIPAKCWVQRTQGCAILTSGSFLSVGWPNTLFRFLARCYWNIQMNFLANPIFGDTALENCSVRRTLEVNPGPRKFYRYNEVRWLIQGPAASWWQSWRLKAQSQAHYSHMEIYIIIHTLQEECNLNLNSTQSE